MSLVPIDTIVAALASRIQVLAAELLPGGRRDGQEWKCGSLAGERGESMAVRLTGAKAGMWADFASGEKGDALDLVAQVLFRGDKKRALPWARVWLGIDRGDNQALAPCRRTAVVRQQEQDGEARRAREAGLAVWLKARPQIAGTPVEDYLAGRGIDMASLGRQPRALRFHPALYNAERNDRLPAMVALVAGADGQPAAVHRTWLEQAGPGDWRKARLRQPKKVLGGYAGGCIRLWRGASGKSLRDAPAGETLDITEGIEDGLSVAMAAPECRVVAAVSLSNVGALVLPPQVRRVCLWRQRDVQIPAIEAAERAVRVLVGRGIEVVMPDLPAGVKDVNELLQARRRA